MAAEFAIQAEALVKRFGDVQALDGIDLEVPVGSLVAVLGPNGAGKTTTVRVLSTLLSPDSGRAWVMGMDVQREAGEVRRRIGLSGQNAAVDGFLTGEENLRMIGRLSGLRRSSVQQRADELLDVLELREAAGRTARTYSGGMRRRLDLAAGLVARPAVLFLDEPTTGLDPRGRMALWQLLDELTDQGTTVLLTTQYLEEADRLADRIAVINHGRVIAVGTSQQLKAKVGGDRLELGVDPGNDPQPVAHAMAGLGSEPAMVDTATGSVVVPISDGPNILAEVVSRLAAADLTVSDLALRRPTLDDVFHSLTGRPTARPAGDNDDREEQ